jgi:phosphoribosyl 1,2-cyclic phosphodiesterase
MVKYRNGATGWRIEHNTRSLFYVTDTEHVPGKLDKNTLNLIEGADLVIYNSTYIEEEFTQKIC